MTTEILKDYIIYKIYCKNKEITEEYYGHTCAFRARKCAHKGNCNNENIPAYIFQIYQIIRSNGGWNNWEMVPIEELKNCSLINAKIREQYHIDLNKSLMNQRKAYITEEQKKEKAKEYENSDKYKEYRKEYRLENREKILEKAKEYRLENSDKNKEKYLENRDTILKQQKQYQLENREKILEKKKEYRLENREIISDKQKEKITCVCGKTFTKSNKSQHERSQFHCQFIQSAM